MDNVFLTKIAAWGEEASKAKAIGSGAVGLAGGALAGLVATRSIGGGLVGGALGGAYGYNRSMKNQKSVSSKAYFKKLNNEIDEYEIATGKGYGIEGASDWKKNGQ